MIGRQVTFCFPDAIPTNILPDIFPPKIFKVLRNKIIDYKNESRILQHQHATEAEDEQMTTKVE